MWVLWTLMLGESEAAASSAVDTEHPCAPDLELNIEIVCGSLTVRGSDRKTVKITGSVDDPEALDVSALPGRVAIEVDGSGRRNVCANLVVDTPRHASITAETVSAPLTVTDVIGRLSLETTSGPITVTGAPASVDAASISGPVTVTGAVSDGVQIETVSGPIRVGGATGRVDAESVSGPIDVTSPGSLDKLDLETMSAPITVSAPIPVRGTWSLESHTGRLAVEVPAETSAVVSWSTFSGQVDCAGVRNKDHEVTLGAGDAQIALETFTGPIRLSTKAP
jgi:DUF4097 and DUF4098 domain-containing protein YvlB